MQRKIMMDYGSVNKLMSVFGCSRQMVSMSLNTFRMALAISSA